MDSNKIFQVVQSAIEKLALTEFVDWWNTGELQFSLISSWRDLEEGLSLYGDQWDDYMDLRLAANCEGVNLRLELKRSLGGYIRGSFATGLGKLMTQWAKKVACTAPSEHGVDGPFATPTEWARWCLRNIELPIVCSPQGCRMMAESKVRPRLVAALLDNADLALAFGWLVTAETLRTSASTS